MKKFDYYLYKFVGKAVEDFKLIEENDKIMVCLSGGKDSYVLLHVLERLKKRAPINFDLHLLHIHPGFENFNITPLEDFMKNSGFEYRIHNSTINKEIINSPKKQKDICFHCSRQRRSIMYKIADETKTTKIALGHHSDDFIESLLMSMFYNSKIETMTPKLQSPRKNFHIIRPLTYVQEKIIEEYSKEFQLPILKDECPYYAGETAKRKFVKNLLTQLEENSPGSKNNIMKSMANINLKRLLDRRYNEEIYE